MGFANEMRGLTIADTDFIYLDEGAYGVVFVSRSSGRIRKVYRRREDQQHVRAVFQSEADAYSRVASSKELAALVPQDFRLCPPQKIVDRTGTDVTTEFFPEMAFETEFVDARFEKIGTVGGDEARRVHTLFHAAGIKFTTDMSVSLTADGRISKAIDFAIEEHEAWHQN